MDGMIGTTPREPDRFTLSHSEAIRLNDTTRFVVNTFETGRVGLTTWSHETSSTTFLDPACVDALLGALRLSVAMRGGKV